MLNKLNTTFPLMQTNVPYPDFLIDPALHRSGWYSWKWHFNDRDKTNRRAGQPEWLVK